jgi:hypothetical protein
VGKKKINVQLVGGLGNQLFGLALGRFIESQGQFEVGFLAPQSGGKNQTHATDLSGMIIFGKEHHQEQVRFPSRIRYAATRLGLGRLARVVDDKEIRLPLTRVKSGTIFRGYFQLTEPMTVLQSKGLLQFDWSQKASPEFDQTLRLIESDEAWTSVHVRFGDYDNLPSFSIDRVRYYSEACRKALDMTDSRAKFLIFTDEEYKAKELFSSIALDFPQAGFHFAPKELAAVETLFLLSQFKQSIIANSTFSWWGAALQKESRLVIAPSPWFRDPDLIKPQIPNSWISLGWQD